MIRLTWCLLLLVISKPVCSLSATSAATWIRAQSQFTENQSLMAYGVSSQGVTRFPIERTVTTPDNCTLYFNVTGRTTTATRASFVARFQPPGQVGIHAWGRAASFDAFGCSSGFHCSNSTSWGFFPSNGSITTAAALLQSSLSLWNTTFDILVQPKPEYGFSYNWRNMSTAILPNQTDVTLGGVAPCCVAMTKAALAKIPDSNVTLLRGGVMGSCDLNTQTAQFDDGISLYNVSQAEDAGMSRVLVMESSASAPSGSQALPPAGSPLPSPPSSTSSLILKNQDEPNALLFQPILENVSTFEAQQQGWNGWRPAAFPGGCSSALYNNGIGKLTTSYPENILNPDDYQTPEWYLPSSTSPNLSDWYVAMLQANLTTGRRYPQDGQWTFGRANLDFTARQAYQGWFPQNGLEWNATRLVSPGLFWVLGSNASRVPGQGFWNESHTFTYGSTNYSRAHSSTEYVEYLDNVPCCIDSLVTEPWKFVNVAANPKAVPRDVRLGNVLGWCNLSNQTASITWLGAVWPQHNFSSAKLLTIQFHKIPDQHRTAEVVGAVIGGLAGLIIVGILATACYSLLTYRARSQRRHIQDAVYNLVMGTCHDSRGPEDYFNSEIDLHGAASMDRFYNLMPFVNRIPHNAFNANLCSKVAGRSIDAWNSQRKAGLGKLHEAYEGHAGQALAFSLMKYESTWTTTDRALVQQWQAGRKGQRHLVGCIEEILQGPELKDFLEGLDAEHATPESLNSKGWLVALARIFFLRLPNHRVNYKVTEAIAQSGQCPDPYSAMKLGSDSDQFGFNMPRLSSMAFRQSTGGASDNSSRPSQSLGLTDAVHLLKLDAYEIKPSEIEVMTNLDGSPAILGKGAFGEVFKAKYNSVQVVAVKQLREEGANTKARVDFLREVAIMKRLHAENIVRFLGVCVQDSRTMLVTEYMPGGDLFNRLSVAEPGGELAWHNSGRRIAVDIARGLAFLHSQQIVHFDLKSPNVLLARDNTAKIADVGLARFMHTDQVTQMTAMGTMAWAAPEVLRGTKDCISTKVDIYSFGVLLWEIVTGVSPRFGVAWYRPPRVPQECPFWVAELITACMLENPAARPTSKDIYRLLLDGNEEAAEA